MSGGTDLPWVGSAGTGVCLSGGGIRAAAFAFGVIQELQEQRKLMYGPDAADHLAVVSGGSYIGATFMLNAAALANAPDDEELLPPLHEESPEAECVLSNGRYLVARGWARTLLETVSLGGWNLLAFAALFLWTGAMLADLAAVVGFAELDWTDAPDGAERWLLAAIAVAGGAMILRAGYVDGGVKRAVLPLLGFLIVAATSASLISVLETLDDAMRDLGWTWAWIVLGSAALLGLSAIPPRFLTRPLWWAVARAASFVPRLVGLALLALAATWVDGYLDKGFADEATDTEVYVAIGVFFGSLIAGWLMSDVSHRVSLHRFYRDGLARCFSVRRTGGGAELVEPTGTPLSAVSPVEVPAARRFPRLLVCATANVVWTPPGGRRRTFAPFVFSHDRCGVPGLPGSSFATTQLELGDVDVRVLSRTQEPLLSLMTAVASTGAAVSPSMGNKTYPALRPLIAIANLRLGRWLPNPLSFRMRDEVEARRVRGRFVKTVLLGRGWDEFVPELFGLHRADAARVYVSDGGHYDNLGLMALLRARCEEIWCVDSQADKKGKAGQLDGVIKLARRDLDVWIEVDLAPFRADDGLLGTAHAVGTVHYPEGGMGKIVVIKLGLTEESPARLKEYRRTQDKRWPYHSTFLAGQWYSRDRIDAYRCLGRANAAAAIDAAGH